MNDTRRNQSVLIAAVVSAVLFLLVAFIQNARWISPAWGDAQPAWSGIHVVEAARPAAEAPEASADHAG